MFIVKKHKTDSGQLLLAIVDKDLLGKQIEERNKILDLKSNFYQGEDMSSEEVIRLVEKAEYLNVVGQNILSLLNKLDLVDKILEISSIPYAHITLIKD